MRFYQKIRFRLIVGAVLLVLVVAVLLTLNVRTLSRDVLRKQEYTELSDETNLRFREVSADIQSLREDVVSLVNVQSVKSLQWILYFERGWIKLVPPDMNIQKAKDRVESDFKDLLKRRPRYRRIEYYLHRSLHNKETDRVRTIDASKPVVGVNHADFPAWKGLSLTADDIMIKRASLTNRNVSFSHVHILEGANGAEQDTLLQVCLPLTFSQSHVQPGLVVVTVDCKPWSKLLTRSPRHLVFLGSGGHRLLIYPKPGRPAYHMLQSGEVSSAMHSFTEQWLTNDDGLEKDPAFNHTFPAEFRYAPDKAPDGHSDADWPVPPDLQFLLLRCRVRSRLLDDTRRREELNATLSELREKHPNLVVGEVRPAKGELLIRAWPNEEQTLRDASQTLERRFGTDLQVLSPIRCTHFVRTLCKFSLGSPAQELNGEALPEECLYLAMASPIEALEAKVDDNLAAILKVVAWCVVGAIALAVLGSFLVTRRLNAITRATQRFAAGKTDVRLPVQDTTEVGLLARSFAEMIEQIQHRQRELQQRTSELETANADLALARDKAEQTTVAKDFFLASVSHELRTPLNHVLGFAQLLEMTELSDAQQRDLNKIQRSAANLLSLVDDLLDYQKIIQGVLTLEPTTIEFHGWIEELAETMRPKIAEKGNTLVLECPADIGTLDADEKRVRQAVTNLLSNAAKFTQKGVVTLTVRRERDEAREWMTIDVHDSGRGMSPEQQTQLFKPFTKLLSRSENPEGTGLGLTLSQRLCRLMGGDLVLSHSAPGEGSTFTIRLPAKTTVTATISGRASGRFMPQERTPSPAPKAISVLVIDDDPDVRELMRRHLEEQGFTVHLAASGAEGLEMVKRVQPDAITLDVLMPGIDGWGTLAALQADAETAHIPVILITMLDDRRRGFALGAWEVLTKPVNWSGLIGLLHHLEPNTGPVLVVDDDPAFREMAERTLSHHGWEVCGAEDGRAALTAAARRRPALVLLDLLMPGMDGFEFLEAFRKEAAWREVPVVVLTAKDLTEEEHRRLDGSVVRILYKGMSGKDEMMMEIERLLRHRAHAGSVESDRMAGAKPPA